MAPAILEETWIAVIVCGPPGRSVSRPGSDRPDVNRAGRQRLFTPGASEHCYHSMEQTPLPNPLPASRGEGIDRSFGGSVKMRPFTPDPVVCACNHSRNVAELKKLAQPLAERE